MCTYIILSEIVNIARLKYLTKVLLWFDQFISRSTFQPGFSNSIIGNGFLLCILT